MGEELIEVMVVEVVEEVEELVGKVRILMGV